MPYTVSRQRQYPDGAPVVEVSVGGIDYTNPDALGAQYPGELQEYLDPREAARVAIEICEAWRKDGEPEAEVAHGATGGMTMPFSPCTYDELREWAEQRYEELDKCGRCGDVLPSRSYTHQELPDERFCSEFCAEAAWEDQEREALREIEVCDSCLDVAYDNGIHDLRTQAETMQLLGADLEDHVCDAHEEPELDTVCNCACAGAAEARRRRPEKTA